MYYTHVNARTTTHEYMNMKEGGREGEREGGDKGRQKEGRRGRKRERERERETNNNKIEVLYPYSGSRWR